MGDPNAGLVQILRRTLPWIRVVSAAGFIMVSILALLAVVSWINLTGEQAHGIPPEALIVYPVSMALVLVPSIYLYKYGRRVETFIAQGHTVQLESALEVQRGFWRFVGMTAAVCGGLLALVLVGAMVIGPLAAV
jgi:hypothetical protein